MRFIEILTPLILCLAAILFLNLWPSNRRQDKLHGLSSSPILLLFLVFNFIIIAILVGNYRPSQEVDGAWPRFLPLNEGQEDMKNKTGDGIEDDDGDGDDYFGSDGYVEDDDDDNSSDDDDIFWKDEEEDDDSCLNRRIESFIAKVNEEWRKERLRDLCGSGYEA